MGGRSNVPARPSVARARSFVDFTPSLILILWNSLFRRVLCRKTACLTGPSPAWIPPLASNRSCTRMSAKFLDVILRSSFSNLAASMVSDSADLSGQQRRAGNSQHHFSIRVRPGALVKFVARLSHFRVSITRAAVRFLFFSGTVAMTPLIDPCLESSLSRIWATSK